MKRAIHKHLRRAIGLRLLDDAPCGAKSLLVRPELVTCPKCLRWWNRELRKRLDESGGTGIAIPNVGASS